MPVRCSALAEGTLGLVAYSGCTFLGEAGEAVMLSRDEGIAHSIPSLILESMLLCLGDGRTRLKQLVVLVKGQGGLIWSRARSWQALWTRLKMRRKWALENDALLGALGHYR